MERTRRPPKPAKAQRGRIPVPAIAALLGLFATVLSAWLCWRVFEGIPHVSDGVSYAFQARIFASGRLWLAPPPVPEVFETGDVVLTADRWASKYPPGFPLLLAVGYLVRVPWLVNPVLLGLAVFGVFRLGRTLYDEVTGLLAAGLLAISPFALILGASYLSHTSALCVSIWALEAFVSGRRTDRARPLLLAGLLAGIAFAIRPYTAAALLLPAGLWTLWGAGPRVALRRAALVVTGAALPLALHASFNAAVFGHPLQTGYALANPTERMTGTRGNYSSPLALLRDHFPRFLVDLNRDPWAWPWPDLLPLLVLLRRKSRRSGDLLLAACSLSLVLAYSFFWLYELQHAGPRYAFETLGALSLLVARGLMSGAVLLSETSLWLRAPAALKASLLLALAGLLVYFPLGRRLPAMMTIHSRAYYGQTLEPLRRPGAEKVGPDALVLVAGTWPWASYASFALLNELDPRQGRRVYTLDVRARREEVLAAYPRQEVWKVFVDIAPWRSDERFAEPGCELRRVIWNRAR
jgi:hypothetical protein